MSFLLQLRLGDSMQGQVRGPLGSDNMLYELYDIICSLLFAAVFCTRNQSLVATTVFREG